MKKKHMLRTGLLLAAFCLALTSCNSSGPSDDPPDPGEETLPKYLSVDRAPVYADVDETVYTTYYFDSVSGSDENTGTDESSPKRTVAAAQALIESAATRPPGCCSRRVANSTENLRLQGTRQRKKPR